MDEPLMQFFRHADLSPTPDSSSFVMLAQKLLEVSSPFAVLAQRLVDTLPRNPERTAALRKLLEAKDCALRAFIYRDGKPRSTVDDEWPCRIIQSGDSVACQHCNLQWDTNDSHPPECPYKGSMK